MRISSVLNEREEWLCANGLESDTVMDMVQRDEFFKWSVNKFLRHQGNSVVYESYRDSLLRFCREQERRVGSTEIWEVLSHTGRATPVDVQNAFKARTLGSRPWPKKMPHPKSQPSPRRMQRGNDYGSPMGQSSADGAGEPVAGKRPHRASGPFVDTLEKAKETQAWLDRLNKKPKHALSREDQASLSRENEAAVVWFASLSKRKRQDFIAIADTTP